MPTSHARVFAHLLDWSDPAPSIAGQLKVRVEYSILEGTRKDGKYTLIASLTNTAQLQQDIIDGLVTFLNAQTPPPAVPYRARDVVLWGS